MKNIKFWILAARPKTLSASWVPVVVGTVLAVKQTQLFNGWVFICTLISSLFIQIATNYLNDAIDFKKGADTAERIGPQRMTQGGFLGYKRMMIAGMICLLVALAFGVPLVIVGGLPIVLIGIVSTAMAYSYTGGPFPLAYLGLGDVFVYMFFGVIAVMGTYFLQTMHWSFDSFWAGSQVGLMSVVLIAINNFRDMHQDRKVSKKTLAVRFGSKFMRVEIFLCSFVPALMGLHYFYEGLSWAFVFPLMVIPLALKISFNVLRTDPSPLYNRFLAMSGALHMLFGVLLSLGIFVS